MEGIAIILAIGWIVVFPHWARNAAIARGHSRYLGLILGLFLGPLGVIIIHKLPPQGGRVAYVGCGVIVTIAAAALAALSFYKVTSQSIGYLIFSLVAVGAGIGLIYRGVTGKEAKLPKGIANPITETVVDVTAQGLAKGPADAVVSAVQNIPEIYRTVVKEQKEKPSQESSQGSND